MQYSFYGGQQGKSFKISGIFETKKALAADLSMRWSSPIGVGEYALVTYGLPDTLNDSEYQQNASIDINEYGRAYNTTLWEKIYLEEGASDQLYPLDANNFELIFPNRATYGIAYKLIAAMTGNTPRIRVATTDVLNADQKPYVTLDFTSNSIDLPVLTFHLPQSQVLHLAATQKLKANQNPYVELNNDDINSPTLTFYLPRSQVLQLLNTIVLDANEDPTATLDSSDIDYPKLQLSIPRSQILHLGDTTVLNADQSPTVAWIETDINNPVVKFSLPQSQIIQLGTTVVADADQKPSVAWDDTTNINRPKITFTLPQSQVLQLGTTQVANANEDPSVTLDQSNINRPKITFSLPKSQIIRLGTTIIKNANESPSVVWDDTSDINEPIVTFSLPQSQVIQLGTTVVANADQKPSVAWNDSTNINRPVVTFTLPQAQVLQLATLVLTNAGTNPTLTLDNTDINKPILKMTLPKGQTISLGTVTSVDADQDPDIIVDESDINNPKWNFELPKSQILQLAPLVLTDVGTQPTLTIDNTDINKPILKFTLPKDQLWALGTITAVDADQDPNITVDNSDVNNPKLNFELPKSQVLHLNDTEIVPPNTDPSVNLDDSDINNPTIKFTLPRAVRMVYGNLLGEKSAGTYNLPLSAVTTFDLAPGDYYVNQDTGFIYEVVSVGAADVVVKFVAVLRAPLPEVSVTEVDPYNNDGSAKTPIEIESTYKDTTEETGWELEFKIPKIPNPDVEVEYVGALESGSAAVAPVDKDTVRFSFEVPRGSIMFAGDEISTPGVTTAISDGNGNFAKNGDLYLNSETGEVYQLRSGIWMLSKGNLKGPKGDSLKTVLALTFDSTTHPNANIDDTALDSDIQTAFVTKFGRYPNEDELIAVSWIDKTDLTNTKEYSYWYFYGMTSSGNKKWDRATLTGGLSSMFLNDYTVDEKNKGYSADYINGLIGGNILPADYNRKTFSVSQILGMLEFGDFASADTDVYPPTSGDYDTLSAAEILELLSWGDLAKLNLVTT